MEKCIIMPDSFKGTMSSLEVTGIMKKIIAERYPYCDIKTVPMADGGEGTIDCLINALGGEKITCCVSGPYGDLKDVVYGKIGQTGIVEMAQAAGFAGSGERTDPARSTTYGVGETIKFAIDSGCKKVMLGLGGTCTNDGGAGIAAALGVKFFDIRGEEFLPTGDTLNRIMSVDTKDAEKILSGISIEALCDIDNPLYGESGAAYVFAPQKGADEKTVKMLDDNLRYYGYLIEKQLGIKIDNVPGAGAAGGAGAGVKVFLGAELKRGVDFILDMIGFENMLEGCDAIFTGEGCFDGQSIGGKTVIGIARRAKAKDVPVIVVAGSTRGDIAKAYEEGVTEIYVTADSDRKPEEIIPHCRADLMNTMKRIVG